MSISKEPVNDAEMVYIEEGSNYLHPPEPSYQHIDSVPAPPTEEYSTLDESVIAHNLPLPPPPPVYKDRGYCVRVCLGVLLVLVVLLVGGGAYLIWKVNNLSADVNTKRTPGSTNGKGSSQPNEGCQVLWRVIQGAGMRGGTAPPGVDPDDCVTACEQDASCEAADVTDTSCMHYYDVTELVFNQNMQSHLVVDRCHTFNFELPITESNNVRLVCDSDIMSDRGRVEVYDKVRDVWGTVCDDEWNKDDATVACKQLGLTAVGHAAVGGAAFGQGKGPIMLDKLSCTGNERTLQECTHSGLYNHTCDHTEDAAVVCGPPDPDVYEKLADTERGIRLDPFWCNGTLGRVEYYDRHMLSWGTVCDDRWDDADAQVVCRTLGLSGGVAMPGGKGIFGLGTGYPLSCLECLGTEAEVLECGHDPLYAHKCQPEEAAALVCQPPEPITYPLPTSCSMRYQAYPSLAGRGGNTIYGISDPEICLQLCSARYTCAAFDINSSTRTCLLYTRQEAIQTFNSPNTIHFKQLEKCAYITFGI